MRKQTIIALMLFVAMFVVASGVMPRLYNELSHMELSREQQVADSLASVTADSLANIDSINKTLDAMLNGDTLNGKGAQNGTDTTMMDSIQLAIYKHNKAIDDSLRLDSINRTKKNGIDAPVVYSGTDSMIYLAGSKTAHIFGDAKVDYEDMKLSSEIIHVSLDSSIVRAEGVEDSLGVKSGTPIFNMGSDQYESDKMAFNFKTRKGLINNVYTQQEDGFMTSTLSKRDSTGAVYMQKGRYTTCEEEHPDFYIALTRAKVRPGKDVVFGPAYLVVADVPLPLAIPYGFFPFSKSYSSGFIMPSYGDESTKGFYLRNGGYYFAISDKMDLKLTGDIYTKGSWVINASSAYNKRYKYNGHFDFTYQSTVTGDKDLPDYSKTTSFKIGWTHTQQSQTPQRFQANVHFENSSFEKNNIAGIYNQQQSTVNTRTSSVSWSTSFASLGLNLSSSANISQTMKDSTISLAIPNLRMDFNQFYPFKRKKAAGAERWYEKIYMKYSMSFDANITAKENRILKANFAKDWSHTINHDFSTGAAFTLLKYITVNPQFTFNDNMYLTKLEKSWDETTQKEKTDTVTGFGNVYRWRLGVSLSTMVYGFFTPSRKIFGDKIMAIRHVMKPSVSFSYAPNFSNRSYGFYNSYTYTDASGELKTVDYCRYPGASISNQMTGSVSFSLGNNVEMKVKSDKDSTGFKKISIIDNLNITQSYNFAATTRQLSDLVVDINLTWLKKFNIPLRTTATFKPYAYEIVTDANGNETVRESNRTEYSYGRFGRYQGMTQSFGYTISPESLRKLFHPDKNKDKNKKQQDDEDDENEDPNLDPEMQHKTQKHAHGGKAETDSYGYMKFSMPWSFTINYSVHMYENTNGTFDKKKMRYPFAFAQTMSFNGNVTLSKGWNISFTSGYDFNYHKMTNTSASLSRDLHCFGFSCSMYLYPYTSYDFTFSCNAQVLKDALKYNKTGSQYSNTVKWY